MEEKRLYPSTQLIALLHPKVLKVYLYLLSWQNVKPVKIYLKRISDITKLSVRDIEIAIQSLIDNGLIQVRHNGVADVVFDKDGIMKYFDVPMKEIAAMELLPVSTNVTWNKPVKTKVDEIDDLSEEQMKQLILRLQASLNEKQQVKKLVNNSSFEDGLPY